MVYGENMKRYCMLHGMCRDYGGNQNKTHKYFPSIATSRYE